jgi:hypothetical protein
MKKRNLVIIWVFILGLAGSSAALASIVGSACAIPGAVERDAGQTLTCDGSVWVLVENFSSYGPTATQAVTSDNVLIDATGKSVIFIVSDGTLATNRTVCLTGGVNGQRLVLIATAAFGTEIIDGAQPCAGSPQSIDLKGNMYFMALSDTLEIVYDGATWREIGRN